MTGPDSLVEITPSQIIGEDAYMLLVFEGYEVVDAAELSTLRSERDAYAKGCEDWQQAAADVSGEASAQREHIRKQAEDIMTLGKLVYASETETWQAKAEALRSRCETLERENVSVRNLAVVLNNQNALWETRATVAEAARDEAVRALERINALTGDLLASLDPDELNPEQFNAWSALTQPSGKEKGDG